MTDENLARVHQTPSMSCGPPLWSLSRSPGVNLLRSSPCVDRKRHDTYILLKVLYVRRCLILILAYIVMFVIVYISYMRYTRIVSSYMNDHHESVSYSFGGESLLACIVILVHSKEFILINSCLDILRDSCQHSSSQRTTSRLYSFPILRFIATW